MGDKTQTITTNGGHAEVSELPLTASKPETASTPKSKRRWSSSDVSPNSTSTSTSTSKNGKSSPDVALSPALSTPDSSKLPKRKCSSRFPGRPDHSAAADSSITEMQRRQGMSDSDLSFRHNTYLAAMNSDGKTRFLKFIDSHCQLDFRFGKLPSEGSVRKYYRDNLDPLPSNFAGCVAVICEPKSFTSEVRWLVALWKLLLNDDMVWLVMGCHPRKATEFNATADERLRAFIRRPKVVAVGDIGLDYSGGFDKTAEIQKEVFVYHIKMALSVNKPLVIHCRDAHHDCLRILKKYVPRYYRIHCHSFTKSYDLAKKWLDYFPNLFIGLTPLVTYSYSWAKEVQDIARKIPLERLLLETDAIYFVPKLLPEGTMELTHPGLAISVAFEVAKLKGINVETVLKHCLQNTKTLYGIKK